RERPLGGGARGRPPGARGGEARAAQRAGDPGPARGPGARSPRVVAFGAILGRELLAAPRLGAINLHGSLLPEYRGASPVQRALWEGRAWTGVTTLWMDEGIDTGDLILQRWCPIPASADAGSLAGSLAELGAPLLAESLVLAHA